MKIIGRYPTSKESSDYNIPREIPAFLPATSDSIAPHLYNERIIEQVQANR